MSAVVVMSLLGLSGSACGDPEPDDTQQASRCGEVGAWSVLSIADAESGGVIGLVGDRVLAWSTNPERVRRLHAAGSCGEGPVEIPIEGALEGDGVTVVVDSHVLVLADDAAHRVDLVSGTSHPAFSAVFSEMHATPLGVLALGLGGKLLLHPDPSQADTEATLLYDGIAWLPRPTDQDPPTWPHLWTDGAQSFALSPDFELMRIDLAGGEPQVELPDVEEFHILDGGNKVVWSGLGDDMLHVTDLGSDEELYVAEQPDGSWDVQEAGRWALLTTDRGRLLSLDTGGIIEPVDFNPTQMLPTNTDSVLLVGNPNGSADRGYWLVAPEGALSIFLAPDACLEFDSQVEPDGIVIADGPCEPQTALYNPLDRMVLRPFDGSTTRTLGQRFGFSYSVLQGDWVLSWDEDVGTGTGRLSADSPEGSPIVLGEEITPDRAITEGLDVYYFQLGTGVQRFALE